MKKIILFSIVIFAGINIALNAQEAKPAQADVKETPEPKKVAKVVDPWEVLPEIVGSFGEEKISRDVLRDYTSGGMRPQEKMMLSKPYIKANASRYVDDYMQVKILLYLAGLDGVKASFEMVAKAFDESFKNIPQEQLVRFTSYLKSQKKTFDEYRSETINNQFHQYQEAIAKWRSEFIDTKVTVSDAEIEEFYNQSADLIRASHILIKPEDNSEKSKKVALAKAQGILKKIRDGEKFETLVVSQSSCQGQGVPGDLGEFGRGNMVQEFEDVAFKLKVNEVSDVVETPFGFHIIKVTGRRKKEITDFSKVDQKVKTQIKQQLAANKGQDIIFGKIKKVKEKIVIKNNIK
jgi:foldase protein PrsA